MERQDIAVVGMSFKLPQGVEDETSFWEVLQARKSLMTTWPESRINVNSFYDANPGRINKLPCRGAHFIKEDPGAFDAAFFSITAKEAGGMDPQHRWTLETAYRAFENAGLPVEQLRGSSTAVFSATFSDDYARLCAKDPDTAPVTAVTGTAQSLLANRVSWFFDLTGPSVQVDTACSSSMVALDLACQSLRNGDASAALVTGSNVILSPERSAQLSNLNFLSPDGVCYSFDHRANGYARGEGVVALVLKPVQDAIRNGDMIRAVIRSSGTNQDGKTVSITQPSSHAQEALIRSVYRKAGLGFESTRYFEAHGTGTPVGDPLEMKAIGSVFRTFRSSEKPLYVGSIKSNVGHLEGCAGLAGIVKSILILETGTIPPNALFEKVNPDLKVDYYNTTIPTESVQWPSNELRRISVNSFGFGGTNAHVVLDDTYNYLHQQSITRSLSRARAWPNTAGSRLAQLVKNGHGSAIEEQTNGSNGTDRTNGNSHLQGSESENGKTNGFHSTQKNGWDLPQGSKLPKLLVWSASDEKALKRMIQSYNDYQNANVTSSPAIVDELAYTLAARRSRLLWRTSAVVGQDMFSQAGAFPVNPLNRSSSNTRLAYAFTGQGSQYVKMGLELIHYPVFKETLQSIQSIYSSFGCDWTIPEQLNNQKTIDRPEYSQPLSTALQIALVELLDSFGVSPSAVVGHSSGEIAAAYASGALSLESACRVSYYRGFLAGELRKELSSNPGAMISVNLAEDEVQGCLKKLEYDDIKSIQVACINSPSNCTLSGGAEAIDVLKEYLDDEGIFAQKLKTGIAYHSSSMQAIAEKYASHIGSPKSGTRPMLPMISSVTGQLISPNELRNAQYWVNNLVNPVRFSQAIRSLVQNPEIKEITDIAEVGSHATLKRPIQDTLKQIDESKGDIYYSSVLLRTKPPVRAALEFIGGLFSRGYDVLIPMANQQANDQSFVVNGPEYPFDHSNVYWAESRLSSDFRLRADVPGALGMRVSDWNPLEPRWRRLLSLDTCPWVGDHVVSDTILFPGMGLLVMAIEAAKQMCPSERQLVGYHVKTAQFIRPVIISKSSDESTEVVIRLRPLQKPYEKESVWSQTSICTYVQGQWSECFNATIQVQYQDAQGPMENGVEKRIADASIFESYASAEQQCTRHVDRQTFYNYTAANGISYGDYFQLLSDIRWDGSDTATASVDVTARYQTSDLVHPAILDSAVQVLITQSSHGATETAPTNVPYELRNGWLSASGWEKARSVRFLTKMTSTPSSQGMAGAIYAVNDSGTVLCNFERLVCKAIATASDEDDSVSNMLHRVEWRPHMNLLSSEQLRAICSKKSPEGDLAQVLKHRKLLESTLSKVLCAVFSEIGDEEAQRVPAFLEKYIVWMKDHVEKLNHAQVNGVGENSLETLFEELDHTYPSWSIFTGVARNLKGILTGQVNPLHVAFDTDLAKIFYSDIYDTICDERYSNLLELIIHGSHNLRIIEVGAGSGGWTKKTLAAIQQYESRTGANAISEYFYTDISPAFFEKAREQLPDLQGRLQFKPLNLEKDVEEQGFDLGHYDVVIAGSVLHATADLTNTVRNVRKLLKPSGHLINLEVVVPHKVYTNFAFGTLPGWWLSTEEWRSSCPCIDESQWDRLLKENQFSGNDLILRDFEDSDCHTFSILVSTAIEARTEDAKIPSISLLADPSSQTQSDVAEIFKAAVSETTVEIIHLDKEQVLTVRSDTVVISLLELDKPFFSQASEHEFQLLKRLTNDYNNILWLTANCVLDSGQPYSGYAQGFFRSVRSERMEKHIVTLSVESTEPGLDLDAAASLVKDVFEASFVNGSTEVEYIVRNGCILTGRLVEDKPLAEDVASMIVPLMRTESWLPGPPLKVSIGTPGLLDTIHFTQDILPQDELDDEEVEIEAKTWGLSFRDIFVALGRLEGTDLGIDCAGVITRVGSACQDLSPGDRVVMTTPGCMRSFPRGHRTCVVKIPDTLSFEVAASILNPGTTAYYCLMEVARLQKGESILIHSATGSTGQLAILLAQMIGAEVYATVGFAEKKQLLIDEFNVPEDHIFYSRNTQFAAGIKRMTGGRGVDVILNSLSGDSLLASWGCIAPYGRFIEIGKSDIVADSPLPMGNFARNVSFCAVDLYHVMESSPNLVARLAQKTVDLLTQGLISHPKPLHVYPVSELEQAFRLLQSGKNTGRIVIKMSPDDQVKKFLLRRSTWTFPHDASYVVSGGMGGLGRAILSWMASKGAKHLIAPSRSGGSSAAAKDAVAELQAKGVNIITPQCDVSSAESLATVLEDCANTMPPIRGCVNASMVLQDSMFDNMTYDQWKTTLASKAGTSWNLHQQLPRALDFFIQFSSLAGIHGSMGQSNYAAGCGFQDALARYRTSRGESGVSFDIGWMQNIGIISENEAYQRQRETAADMRKVQGEELLAIMDIYCDPAAAAATERDSQLLIGVMTPEDQIQSGLEFPTATVQRPLFAGFTERTGETQAAATGSSGEDPVRLFKQAETPKEKAEVVVKALANKLAHALGIIADDVVPSKHLSDYGVDSLMAVELRNWIAAAFKSNVAVFDIMGAPSILDAGNVIVGKSELVGST